MISSSGLIDDEAHRPIRRMVENINDGFEERAGFDNRRGDEQLPGEVAVLQAGVDDVGGMDGSIRDADIRGGRRVRRKHGFYLAKEFHSVASSFCFYQNNI